MILETVVTILILAGAALATRNVILTNRANARRAALRARLGFGE